MRIYVGADYRGFACKQELLKFLADFGAEVTNLGIYELPVETPQNPADSPVPTGVEDELSAWSSSAEINPEYDYNTPARAVAEAVREDRGAYGILICDSAHGMTMQANRYTGIRAANCDTTESARLAREHDDANVLCLSAHFTDGPAMQAIVKTFLETIFTPIERRVRRINRLDERGDYD